MQGNPTTTEHVRAMKALEWHLSAKKKEEPAKMPTQHVGVGASAPVVAAVPTWGTRLASTRTLQGLRWFVCREPANTFAAVRNISKALSPAELDEEEENDEEGFGWRRPNIDEPLDLEDMNCF